MPFVVSLSNHALCVESADQDNPALPRKAWFDRLTTNGICDGLTMSGAHDTPTANGVSDRLTTNRVFDGLTTDGVTESAIA
jgi:hypothetical protein